MPRGRKKKVKLDLSLKPEFIKSMSAITLIVFSGVALISFFLPTYSLNTKIQHFLFGAFGWGSIFVPVILMLLGLLLIDPIKIKFKSWSVLVGLVLMQVCFSTFIHLFYPIAVSLDRAESGHGGGMLGYNLSQLLINTISIYGAVLILLALGIVAFIMVTSVSLDQIFGVTLGALGKLAVFKNLKMFGKKSDAEGDSNIEIEAGTGEVSEKTYNEGSTSYKDSQDNPFYEPTAPATTTNSAKSKQEPVIEILPSPSEPFVASVDPLPASGVMDTSLVSLASPSLPYSDKVWETPPLDLLIDTPDAPPDTGDIGLRKRIIKDTLKAFGISVEVVDHRVGPAVTQYILEADGGTRIAKITNLQSDIALALASPTGSVRIEAPIPGKSQIGIEVPNNSRTVVNFKDLLTSDPMKAQKSKLAVVMGKDVAGLTRVYDIAKMPHLLVAGATGSGKSVFLHSVIFSILYRASPAEVKFIMIDPKRVELVNYQDIPHLLTPVITDIEKSPAAFRWAVKEMEDRYKLLEKAKARNIESYNEKSGFQAMPYIVLVIDELAEIMVVDPAGVEKNIIRLGQLARAVGIHMVLAVQRPSTDILTGLIKANIPARAAFNVTSQVDSRVIIDQPGAEKLLGKGDMLWVPPDVPKPTRLQGAFIRDKEINALVTYLKGFGIQPDYEDILQVPAGGNEKNGKSIAAGGDSLDPLYEDAKEAVVSSGKGSSSFLQRRFSIGYARAARILDELEKNGVIGPQNGSKPREIYVTSSGGGGFSNAASSTGLGGTPAHISAMNAIGNYGVVPTATAIGASSASSGTAGAAGGVTATKDDNGEITIDEFYEPPLP